MKKNVIKTILISLSVVLITTFFCSLKHNLFIDEMISFGLANNKFSTNLNDYTVYTGEHILLDFASVKEGKQFDFANLIENQKNDTHPPFWYALLNIVCSLNTGKWSMWYGLIINIILMIFIFWAIRWIYVKLLQDEKYATIFSYLTILTNAIISLYAFIRMYTLLTLITLLFFIVVIKEMFYKDENLEKKQTNIVKNNLFYLYFYLLIVIGTLTHYHFLLAGGLIGIMYCLYLLNKKYYRRLITTAMVATLGLFSAYLIFPHMINHLFFSTGLHSVSLRESTRMSQNVFNFFKYIYTNVFGYSIYIYIIVALLYIFSLFSKKNKNIKSHNNSLNVATKSELSIGEIVKYIYIMMAVLLVVYYIVLLVTIKFSGERYLYNWFVFFVIFVYSGIYNISKCKLKGYKVFTLILIIISVLLTKVQSPRALYMEDDKILNYYTENSDKKMLVCYDVKRKWAIANIMYIFKNMKNVTLVNASVPEFQRYGSFEGNQDFFVTVFDGLNDEQVINSVASVNNVDSYELRLDYTSRYRIYRLFNSSNKE